LTILIIISILVGGCVQKNSVTLVKNQEEKQPSKSNLSTLELSELAITQLDLPSNFTLKERAERVIADISPDALDYGWKKGYYVRYMKIGDNIFDVTIIEQIISIYPFDNISKTLTVPRLSGENITYDTLSKPNIGENSRAFRITIKENNEEKRLYKIEFFKMDVYEALLISGTTTDYELLQDLAKKAENKIR
jgi:uncharacterized protein YkuJ